MKISEYVRALEAVMQELGDVEVETDGYTGRTTARLPSVAYRMVLTGRESKQRFAYSSLRGERIGEAVCKV